MVALLAPFFCYFENSKLDLDCTALNVLINNSPWIYLKDFANIFRTYKLFLFALFKLLESKIKKYKYTFRGRNKRNLYCRLKL